MCLPSGVLNTLSDGSLAATENGHVYIQTDDAYKDAITGKTAEVSDAQQITLNNTLRTKVAGALSGLQLASPDMTKRRDAIAALLKNPDASMKPMIDRARAAEQDHKLKKRLDTLWAMTALHNPGVGRRLEAAQLVAARHDLDMYEPCTNHVRTATPDRRKESGRHVQRARRTRAQRRAGRHLRARFHSAPQRNFRPAVRRADVVCSGGAGGHRAGKARFKASLRAVRSKCC